MNDKDRELCHALVYGMTIPTGRRKKKIEPADSAAIALAVGASCRRDEDGLIYCKLLNPSGDGSSNRYTIWAVFSLLKNAVRLRHEAEPVQAFSIWLANEAGEHSGTLCR